VAPGTDVPVTGVGVIVEVMIVGARSVTIVDKGEALRVGKGVSVEAGCIGTTMVILGLVLVLAGWDVAVGS